MKLNNVRHIFFDLDHTLWDFDKNSELAFQSIFQNQGIQLEISDFLNVYMPINLKYWRMYRNNTVSKEDLRYGRLKESFDFLKYKIEDKTIHLLAEDYINFLPQNNILLEGTLELLEYLKDKYKLHIITNGFEEVQHKKMQKSGITDYFSSITTSEEAGVKKPDAKIFHYALSKSEATAETSLMIGDSIEADILGAQNIGMKAIYFNYYKSELSGNYQEVRKLSELFQHL